MLRELGGSFCSRANLHRITLEAACLGFGFFFSSNSHPFCVINKMRDGKLIQPSDVLFMLCRAP